MISWIIFLVSSVSESNYSSFIFAATLTHFFASLAQAATGYTPQCQR